MNTLGRREGAPFGRGLLSFFVAVIGGGVVFLPKEIQSSGILLGLICLTITGWLSHENCRLMDLTAQMSKRQGVVVDGVEDLGYLAGCRWGGSKTGVLVWGSITFVNLFDLYLTSLQKLAFFVRCTSFGLVQLGLREPTLNFGLCWSLTLCAFSLVIFAENVEFLSRINWVGASAMFAVIGLMVAGSLEEGLTGAPAPVQLPMAAAQQVLSEVGLLYGTFIFSFAAVETYLYILRTLKNPEDGISISFYGHLISGALYGTVGLLGYLAFHDRLSACFFLTVDLSPTIALGISFFLMIGCWPSFLLYFLPILEQFEKGVALGPGNLRLVSRFCLLSLSVWMAASFEVSDLTAFTGNLTTNAITNLFPGMLFWLLRSGGGEDGLEGFPWRSALASLVSFLGFGLGLFFLGVQWWTGTSDPLPSYEGILL